MTPEAVKRWTSEAIKQGRFLALHQIQKHNGSEMTRQQAKTFFKKMLGFNDWTADIAAGSYKHVWANKAQSNPLSESTKEGLKVGAGAAAAFILLPIAITAILAVLIVGDLTLHPNQAA
jgi:hypothetical protein